jgi:hypothetical protein
VQGEPVAQLEQRNRDLWEDVQRFRAHALNEKDARMALERELEAVRKDAEWRPIETAPKDGTAVLVSEGRFCYCVEWNEEFDWWAVDDNKLGPFRLRGAAPTHWMPLPPPPDAVKEKP